MRRTLDEVVGEGEARRVTERPRVLVASNLETSVSRLLDVVVRIVDGLERVEFRREFVGDEVERSIVVEDVRIARTELRLQMQEVIVVAEKPRWAGRVDHRHARPILTVAHIS